MAENNVVFTNNTTKQLYLQDQHFWSGTSVAAPADRIPTGSTAEGKQEATANGDLKFATVYVDSLAVVPTTRKFISAFDISSPKEFGPYGTQSPKNYSLILGPDERIKEVIVRHGFIVDAIGFVVVNDKTGTTYTKIFGGNGGDETKIPLKSDEYITQISGTSGKFAHSSSDSNVAKLTIHTNLKQYGPFGKGQLVQNSVDFESPTAPIIGFFGRNDNYIQSVGGYFSTSAASKAYAECGPIGPIDWNVVEVKLGMSKPSVVYVDHILGGKVESTAHDNGDATVAISDN
ncbi:mannose/glucose-specific lectin-like [Silene latifolia]|uniref:mannose/glucose-specific lectin-like n=1 Tax=Silene latifolia TaxID=37657 RepID=UPI003D775185